MEDSLDFDLEKIKKLMMSDKSSNKKENHKNNNHVRNNSRGRSNNGQQKKQTGYVGAPYNFVPFATPVYEYPEGKLTKHNDVSEELLTGEITYEIMAETSIMIDDGSGYFHKTPTGEYSIPGSTMRGLIRNNVQILGFSSFYDDIDDYALMYRNVAGATKKNDIYGNILGAGRIPVNTGDKNQYISVLKNVQAGYLANESGKYIIYRTKKVSIEGYGEMNYYALSERKVVQDYFDSKKGKPFRYEFFVQDGKSIMQHQLKEFQEKIINNRVHYQGVPNKGYRPFFCPVSYEIENQKDITAVGKPGTYTQPGYVMSTGKMNEKKVIYIIPEIDKERESLDIPSEALRSFQIDVEKKKNTLKLFGGREFFDLPKEGEMKPVFYIEANGRTTYFGFTPYLRLFYGHTVKEGLPEENREGIVDYGKAIFGYSSTEKSYKSKVSFSDAVVCAEAEEGSEVSLILAEPKPTSYLDYLKQDNSVPENPITYNNSKMELRGVKQYWLHRTEDSAVEDKNKKNDNVLSKLHPLKKGTKFRGKVRFHNMTEDELGLLLWSIQLDEKKSHMNVGKAKSFGYGNISVKLEDVKRFNKREAYALDRLELKPFEKVDVPQIIQVYKDHINKFLNGCPVEQRSCIEEFFMMKDHTIMPDTNKIRYMNLGNEEYRSEYQSRKKALPEIKELVDNRQQKKENQ